MIYAYWFFSPYGTSNSTLDKVIKRVRWASVQVRIGTWLTLEELDSSSSWCLTINEQCQPWLLGSFRSWESQSFGLCELGFPQDCFWWGWRQSTRLVGFVSWKDISHGNKNINTHTPGLDKGDVPKQVGYTHSRRSPSLSNITLFKQPPKPSFLERWGVSQDTVSCLK